MLTPVCSCAHLTVEGRVIRHLDQMCPEHAKRDSSHCYACGAVLVKPGIDSQARPVSTNDKEPVR